MDDYFDLVNDLMEIDYDVSCAISDESGIITIKFSKYIYNVTEKLSKLLKINVNAINAYVFDDRTVTINIDRS